MLNQYNLPWLQQLRNGPNTREAGYNYEPLPSTDWIRLLKLKPGKKSEELDCELEICSIDFLPKYEALSYSMYLVIIPFHMFSQSVYSSRLIPNCYSVG
jgi:hypothetical protein